MVLNPTLHELNTASNSFQKYFCDFLRDLGFTPSRADKKNWICKSDNYEGYDHIATHVDDIIIAANNISKYMHEIDMKFKVKGITDSSNY